jgi:hypothetical protein
MHNFREIDINENFFKDITTYKSMTDDKVELVIDLTASQYFDSSSQLFEIIQFSHKKADEGHDVFFGPAIRNKDLGAKRSDHNNVCATKSLWIDIDSPDKDLSPDQRLIEAEKLLNEFLIALNGYGLEPSYIVESGHGYHVYFVLKKFFIHPSDIWQDMQNAIVSLAKGDVQAKDPGRLLRVPGTYNYKDRANPKMVRIIHASGKGYIEDDFRQLIIDHGPKKSFQNVAKASGSKPLGFIPPCIASLLNPQNKPPLGHRHQVRQILATYAFHEGWAVEKTIQSVMHTTDDPKKAERDIKGVYNTLQRDPERYSVGCGEGSSLKNLVDVGVAICDKENCEFNKPKEAKDGGKKEKYSAWFDGLVDIVHEDDGENVFLVKDDGVLMTKDKHETSEAILIPPKVDKIIWNVSSVSKVIEHYANDNDLQLFEDLVEYHKTISELPSENHYKYIAAWVMHTYLFDNCEYSPVNWLYAIPERGKSRTGKACIYVAWRGIHVITLKEAHIIRLATDQRATIFFDIMDFWKRVAKSDTEDIMLARFERGAQVPRVLYPEKGAFEDTVHYDVYGPTIIATNETIGSIMQTRAVQIIMPESSRNFDDDVKPEMGLSFRERLVAFRARWMDKSLPQADKPTRGRLGDILRPIRQIIKVISSDETWFMDFVGHIEENRKSEGIDSQDAIVVSAIVQALPSVKHNHLLHKDTLDIINRHRPEQFRMSPHSLGRITTRLGFERYSSGDGRGIKLNGELLAQLCIRYGIEWKKEKEITTI